MWVAFGDSTLARVEPGTVRVSGSTIAGGQPAGVVVGSGSVWVSNSDSSTVQRFAPTTFEEAPLKTITVGRRPTGMAAGDGAIWVAITGEDVRRGSIRAAPPSHDPCRRRPDVGRGRGWGGLGGEHRAGTVSRIDPETNRSSRRSRSETPRGIAVAEGLVWVTVQAR